MPKAKIKVVPGVGDIRELDVEFESGSTLAQVAKKAGIDFAKQKCHVNVEAAKADTVIPDGATITFTEKPRGS